MAFSQDIRDYIWQSDDEDDDVGDAATAATLAPPQPASEAPGDGVVSAKRVAEMSRHLTALSRPAIRSSGQVPHAAPRPAPQMAVVDHPLDIADRPSPTAARSPAGAATTRHRHDPTGDYTQDWRQYMVRLFKSQRWWESIADPRHRPSDTIAVLP